MGRIKIMERIWNYLYYYIYLFEIKASNIITYPFSMIFDLIYKIPAISNGLKKKGSSPKKLREVNSNLMRNRVYGQSINFANIQIGGLLVFVEFGLFNLLQAILGKSLIQYVWEEGSIYKWLFIIGGLVIAYIINNQLLWKNDKYLKYFEEFDKSPKEVRRKWAWISLGIVIGILGFFVLSFIIAIKVLGK